MIKHYSDSIKHNLSKGMIRERVVFKLLRSCMPMTYGISGGECLYFLLRHLDYFFIKK